MAEPNSGTTDSPPSDDAGTANGSRGDTRNGPTQKQSGWSTSRVVVALITVALLAGGGGFYLGSQRSARMAGDLPGEKQIIPVKELLKPIVQVAGRELAINFINGKAPFKLEIRIGDRAPILTETTKARSKVPIGEPPASGESIRVTAIDATGQRVTAKIKAPY